MDLVAPCGSAIYPIEDGEIVDVIDSTQDRNFNSLGYMVLIKHPGWITGRPFYSISLHMLEKPNVRVGDEVNAGQTVLGRIGQTGVAEGCHTHFEIRYFSSRFSAWANIYGAGDKRNDPYFLQQWEDPVLLFNPRVPRIGEVENDGRLGSGCGCSFSFPQYAKTAHNRWLYSSIEKSALMNIDGRDVLLQHVKGGWPDAGGVHPFSRETLRGEAVAAQIDYLSEEPCDGIECEVTYYDVLITVETPSGKRAISATGTCGC